MAPAGFLTSTFLKILSVFSFSQKMGFRFVCRWGISVFWVSPRLLCERSRERRIPPCPGPFFNFSFFVFFASFFSDKKRLRQSGLVPAMSTFATPFWDVGTRVLRFFLAKRVEENHRCDAFLAKKYDGAELAPSRWMALLRRHFDASARAANPTVS